MPKGGFGVFWGHQLCCLSVRGIYLQALAERQAIDSFLAAGNALLNLQASSVEEIGRAGQEARALVARLGEVPQASDAASSFLYFTTCDMSVPWPGRVDLCWLARSNTQHMALSGEWQPAYRLFM